MTEDPTAMTIDGMVFVRTFECRGRERWGHGAHFVLERIHTEGPWTPLLDGSPLSLYGQTAEEAFKLMKRHVKHERNRFDELWDLFE